MLLRKLIEDYLKEAKLMTLATCDKDKPWAATVWFIFDDKLNLYFISQKQRRHSLELKRNPKIAGTIVFPHEIFGVKVRGIQFEGEAYEASALELPNAYTLFAKRFPKVKENIKSVMDIIKNITRVRFYKIVPSRIVLYDEVNFPDNPRQELLLRNR